MYEDAGSDMTVRVRLGCEVIAEVDGQVLLAVIAHPETGSEQILGTMLMPPGWSD